MKNKRGFTLIELLAVIAILAILLILAIPNVIKMFNNAKVNSFVTEAQSIINTAEKQYMSNQLSNSGSTIYYCYDGETVNTNKLNLSGNDEIKYYIGIKNGKVTVANVSTEGYSVFKEGTNIDVADITNEEAIVQGETGYQKVSCKKQVTINVSGGTTTNNVTEETAEIGVGSNAIFNVVTTDELFDNTGGVVRCENGEGKLEDGVVTISDVNIDTTCEVMLQTTSKCFEYSGNTITGYYTNLENNTSNTACPTDVVLASKINNNIITAIGERAISDKGLTNLSIPDSITSIGNNAFLNNKLTNLIIPNSITELGNTTFAENELESVILPDGIVSIGWATFASNRLSSIVIPDSVKYIDDAAFSGNILSSVIIPNKVITIGSNAFYGNKLTSIIIPASVTTITPSAFSSNPLTSVCIKKPENTIASPGGAFSIRGVFGWAEGYSDSDIIWNCTLNP